jgi:hypothetical protein
MLNMARIIYTRVRPVVTAMAAVVFSALISLHYPAIAQDRSVNKVRQVGAFHKWENALALSVDIRKSGKKTFIMEKTLKGKVFYAVLEGEQDTDVSSGPLKFDKQGYVQAGAFLSKQNAEQMIISLRQQGAITFHCMKKADGKIYYKVYRKTGVVRSSPCTLEVAEGQKPDSMLKPNASLTPPPAAPASGATEHPVTGITETEGMEPSFTPDTQAPRFIVNTSTDDMPPDTTGPDNGEAMEEAPAEDEAGSRVATAPEQAGGEGTSMQRSEAAGDWPALPLTGPPPIRPPLMEAPQDIVLDISPINPIDDNRHFYIKPEAVVFTERNQFGSWYASFNEFGGGTVTGQSNKWYIVRFREGVTGYVQKADTVEYTLPYEDEEQYR